MIYILHSELSLKRRIFLVELDGSRMDKENVVSFSTQRNNNNIFVSL